MLCTCVGERGGGAGVNVWLSSNYADNDFIIICFVMNYVDVLLSTKSLNPYSADFFLSNSHVIS